MARYQVVIEPDLEDGGYVVHCPGLPGCISQGQTREEALANIKEAIEAYLESLAKDKLAPPGYVRAEVVELEVP
jgi:predicted RNase H-like HicB family nuclease